MNLNFTCSLLSAQSSSFSLIVCIFNLNSNENIHIGLLYHSTTSVHFISFVPLSLVTEESVLSCVLPWNEWLNRKNSYYIPGRDWVYSPVLFLFNLNIEYHYTWIYTPRTEDYGERTTLLCIYCCQLYVSIKFKQYKSLQSSELRHFRRRTIFLIPDCLWSMHGSGFAMWLFFRTLNTGHHRT